MCWGTLFSSGTITVLSAALNKLQHVPACFPAKNLLHGQQTPTTPNNFHKTTTPKQIKHPIHHQHCCQDHSLNRHFGGSGHSQRHLHMVIKQGACKLLQPCFSLLRCAALRWQPS